MSKLSKYEIEKTKKNSIKDGAGWGVMFGFGEQYISPFAIKLGASNSEIGFLSSIPTFISSIFQILGAKLTDNWRNRKKVVLLAVFIQILILMPLFIIPLLTKNVILLIVFFTIYLICANVTGPAWSSWIGEVVPENQRNKYFAKRNKIVMIFTLISILIAGMILYYFTDENIWLGFGILFVIATIGRIVSLIYLFKQHEPKYEPSNDKTTFFEFIKNINGTNFSKFVIFRSLLAFAVMIGSPFLAVFLLKEFQFSYLRYTLIILTPMIAKILTMSYWGKYSEKVGTKTILFASGILVSIIPLGWFVVGYFVQSRDVAFMILLISEFIGGFAWAGVELATFNFMLETLDAKVRTKYFAYFNVIFGFFVMIGGLIGALILKIIQDANIFKLSIHGLLVVFFLSFILRLVVIIYFEKQIRDIKVKSLNNGHIYYELVVAKPLNAIVNNTNSVLIMTESKIKKFNEEIISMTNPINPIIENAIKNIDGKLDKAENIRKKISPKVLKKHKKEIFRGLEYKGKKR